MFNKKMVLLSSLMVAAGSAQAALPTEATDAITALQTDGTAMIDAVWPVVVAITGGIILIKLFKKVIFRAT